ncbi:MAG: SBBP repeat-containing protein, partial [Candidatus Zixiibacteriota bacterium]
MNKVLLIFLFIFFFTLPLFAQSVDTAWVRRYNGPGNSDDEAYAIAADGSGNVYVTGRSRGSGTLYDYATIKHYPDGDTAWVRRYNGPVNSHDEAYAIAVDGSGNVYVTGLSVGSGTLYDYATIQYYANGDTAWVRRYNGPGNDLD